MNVFAFFPNWQTNVTENLIFKTDILMSPTGAEQRIARRLTPRRTFEFTLLVEGVERQRLINHLIQLGASECLLPLYAEIVVLDADVQSGTISIPFNTSYREFNINQSVLLVDESTQHTEIGVIKAITQNSILLTSPLQYSFSAGASVYPLVIATLTDPPQLTDLTNTLSSVSVRFRVQQNNPFESVLSLPRYRDHVVFNLPIDWTQSPTLQFERLLLEQDNDSGLIYRIDTAKRAFALQSFLVSLDNRRKQAECRSLIYLLNGRQRAIWLRSTAEAFTVISNQNTVIVVEQNEYKKLAGCEHIAIELINSDVVYRKIIDVREITNSLQLVVDSPIVGRIATISTLTLSRLNHDQITWQHITDSDGLAQIKLNFRGVRDDLESL